MRVAGCLIAGLMITSRPQVGPRWAEPLSESRTGRCPCIYAAIRCRATNWEGTIMARISLAWTLGAALSAAMNLADVSWAQQQPTLTPPYKVIPLLRDAVTGDPNKEAIIIRVEWPPNVS